MRSYILAIAVALFLSAAYAIQNDAEVTVYFFGLRRAFPQGWWDIAFFAAGALLMWLFSIVGSLEIVKTNRRETKERDRRIAALEEEKKSLLAALQNLTQTNDIAQPAAFEAAPAPLPPEALEVADETIPPEAKGTVAD